MRRGADGWHSYETAVNEETIPRRAGGTPGTGLVQVKARQAQGSTQGECGYPNPIHFARWHLQYH